MVTGKFRKKTCCIDSNQLKFELELNQSFEKFNGFKICLAFIVANCITQF